MKKKKKEKGMLWILFYWLKDNLREQLNIKINKEK